MPKFISVMLGTMLIILLLAPKGLAPTVLGTPHSDEFDQIITDIVADYEVIHSLLHDVCSQNGYLIAKHAHNTDSASAYLAEGFDQALAQSIVDYYLRWLPELNRLAVVPTESIPIITSADIPYLNIQRISPDMVLIKRLYRNCYEQGDKYLYSITVVFKDGRWLVFDLQLNPL